MGPIILILAYLGFILALEFFQNDFPGAQHWEAKGLRATWLTVAQLPLLLLLAGKNNLIGYLVGASYERLQIFHWYVGRTMLLTATLHGAYQAYGWNKYGLLQIEISTDSCIPTGERVFRGMLSSCKSLTLYRLRDLDASFLVSVQ
jgi:hypothetical protein